MSVLAEGDDTQVPRLDFELTAGCDHKCGHCYNVWTASGDDPQAGYDTTRPLPTPRMLELMSKAVTQSGAHHLTLTGGEPMLRTDALEVIEHACAIAKTVTLITNGSHITEEVAERLAGFGIASVQLTLLAGNRELHDRLKGAVCFDDTVRAAVRLVRAGVHVQVCFVAMRENAAELRAVMELCVALGVGALSYNRMSPTGRAIHHIARLLPTADEIEEHLDLLDALGRRWNIRVGTAMPVPPCLVRLDRYDWIDFGFCSTGSKSPNLVVDPKGDVRSCNLSSQVLGNLVEQDWPEVFAHPYPRTFKQTVPELCRGCAYERTCQGGCKESGFATFGDHTHPEPLVWLGQEPGRLAGLLDRVAQREG